MKKGKIVFVFNRKKKGSQFAPVSPVSQITDQTTNDSITHDCQKVVNQSAKTELIDLFAVARALNLVKPDPRFDGDDAA